MTNCIFLLHLYLYVLCKVAFLRSEIPSDICAKLRTVAASNNRIHMT